MDPEGNYLLLGGSGDEYSYSAESNGQVSDIWVSYLVVVGNMTTLKASSPAWRDLVEDA